MRFAHKSSYMLTSPEGKQKERKRGRHWRQLRSATRPSGRPTITAVSVLLVDWLLCVPAVYSAGAVRNGGRQPELPSCLITAPIAFNRWDAMDLRALTAKRGYMRIAEWPRAAEQNPIMRHSWLLNMSVPDTSSFQRSPPPAARQKPQTYLLPIPWYHFPPMLLLTCRHAPHGQFALLADGLSTDTNERTPDGAHPACCQCRAATGNDLQRQPCLSREHCCFLAPPIGQHNLVKGKSTNLNETMLSPMQSTHHERASPALDSKTMLP